ncbi:MAG: DNA repair protein RecN [Thermodesulfobacteriota bacterium]|nr:MAG: DNA repair protein RecN [Thermodesulfobacteriota bacterium]
MILDLKIYNLVLIEKAHLELDKGFIVFTGETGAGKSLLVKAIKLILGAKGGSSYIKPGSKEGEIEALIWGGEKLAKRLEEMGYSPEEEIHIRRIISSTRQKTYLNGSPITLSELSKITKGLISLTSQHEFYEFLSPEKQIEFLDQTLGLQPLLKEYQDLFFKYKEIKNKVKELEKKISDLEFKKDFLMFQIKELEELNPDPKEEEELLKLREKLKNLSQLKETINFLISQWEATEENLSQFISAFENLAKFETSFKESLSRIYSFYYELKEINRDIAQYFSTLPEDDSQLDEIENRLAKYEKLKRKHKTDTQGLKILLEKLKNEINLLEFGEEEYEKLKREEEKLKEKVIEEALQLSEKRIKYLPKLKKLLEKELKELGMEKVRIEIELKCREPKDENLSIYGLDEIKLLFSPNPGIPLNPLEKIASGGELSRFFLASKSLLKDIGEIGTFVFDEIDTGIGGITAKKVAQKLKTLSETHQILCITHLPQIAALADIHYIVEKESKDKQTITKIKKIEGKEKLKEIARMLGSPENLELAKKFLAQI